MQPLPDQKQLPKERLYHIISRILENQVALDIKPIDIALLIVIYEHLKAHPSATTTLAESEIKSLHKKIENWFPENSATSESRASGSISRLFKAGCLVRADINRLQTSDQELALTQLAESIAEWHLRQDEFSGESLTVILREFNSQLAAIADRAANSDSDEEWARNVKQPIQYVLIDMLNSIRRHQNNLDISHQSIRNTIPALLSSEGEEAISQCEAMLEKVIATITDLHHVTFAARREAE